MFLPLTILEHSVFELKVALCTMQKAEAGGSTLKIQGMLEGERQNSDSIHRQHDQASCIHQNCVPCFHATFGGKDSQHAACVRSRGAFVPPGGLER